MQPGAQSGHFKTLSAIANGGIGAVWKANDIPPGREIAIKMLPEGFVNDADR